MRNMSQFKSIIAALLTQTTVSHDYLHNMIYQNSETFNYVDFFSNSGVRNEIIPEFDHINKILTSAPTTPSPTVYDNKFLEFTKRDIAPGTSTLDRGFWSHYVRNHIHAFVSKTWTQYETSSGIWITRAEADQILRLSHRVHGDGPESIKVWENMIKSDYMYKHEIVYSNLFDVKMTYNGEVGDRHKRPVYLYSYGPKAWANCMSFLLRMHWNNLCAQTI